MLIVAPVVEYAPTWVSSPAGCKATQLTTKISPCAWAAARAVQSGVKTSRDAKKNTATGADFMSYPF